MISALDGGEWSASPPGSALAPVKGPIRQEAGWVPEQVWTQRLEENSFGLCQGSKLDSPVVQPVARYYTDWATSAPGLSVVVKRNTETLNSNTPRLFTNHLLPVFKGYSKLYKLWRWKIVLNKQSINQSIKFLAHIFEDEKYMYS
jgi:hypothetical protein